MTVMAIHDAVCDDHSHRELIPARAAVSWAESRIHHVQPKEPGNRVADGIHAIGRLKRQDIGVLYRSRRRAVIEWAGPAPSKSIRFAETDGDGELGAATALNQRRCAQRILGYT